jgi:hypothetical protein
MAGSGALRERKRESVQFWLAIAAVSFLFHALLIVGIKRWATIAVVEPDAGAIAVELVEPAGSESVEAPIVQAAALKPEAKSEAKPDLKSQVQPEFEIKSEPIVQPEVKAEVKKPAIASTPKPDRSLVPPKKNPQSGPSGSSGPKKDPTKGNQNSLPPAPVPAGKSDNPVRSSTKLPPRDEIKGPSSFSASTDGEPRLLYGDSAALKLMQLPPIVLSARFAKNVGKTLNISVSFIVKCPTSQKSICEPSFIQTELQSQTPPSGLTSEDDLELESAIEKWFALVRVSSLVFAPDPIAEVARSPRGDTIWNMQVTLKVES